MKLRLDKNSVRLRVKKSDLETLRQKNSVEESLSVQNASFIYKLSISDLSKEVEVVLKDQSIEVMVSPGLVTHWMNTDEVGIYHTIIFPGSHSLDVIVEKDFPCADRKEPDPQDSFSELSDKIRLKQC